jgi:two-component system, response regulator PdtaR
MLPVSVFIVEDELIEAEDIRMTLEKLGYRVSGIARSGEVALEALIHKRPDLVLMDIHLAGVMDGIEAAEQIRALYRIPVAFLTSHADDTNLERAKVTEPYGYILKPFDERELHSVIEMALYKHRMEDVAKEHARTIQVLANAIPDAVVLLDKHMQILALNDAMARRLGWEDTRIPDETSEMFDRNGVFTSLRSPLDEVMRTGRSVRYEEKNGDAWFEISLHPITEPDRECSRVLVHYHDVTDHKHFEEQLKKEGITRIEQNMEQFQILNDQIRNPIQAIMGYVNLDCMHNRERILEQIRLIDTLVDRLDHGWVESEKVRKFLLRHYRDNPHNPDLQDTTGPDGWKA